jgi:hypothetical protein
MIPPHILAARAEFRMSLWAFERLVFFINTSQQTEHRSDSNASSVAVASAGQDGTQSCERSSVSATPQPKPE